MKKISIFIISMMLIIMSLSGEACTAKSIDSSTALDIVNTLSVIDTEVDHGESVVTRKLAALYVARMLNIDNKTSDVRYFVDVENEQFATHAINNLVSRGIISVTDDKRFRPDENITYDEMLKMLICALGYGTYADLNGGWMNGYYKTASMLKISYKPEKRDMLTVLDVANLIIQTFEAPVYELGTTNGSFTYESGESLIWKTKNISIKKGTVEAVGGMTITDTYTGIGLDKIVISGELYDIEYKQNIMYLLGNYVEFYVKESDDKQEVIFLISDIKGSGTKVIDIKNFSSYSTNSISYYDERGRLLQIKLHTPRCVYNGEFLDENINNTMDNLNKGNIYVKDSNGDDLYDIVIVENFDSRVVNSIDITSEVIYFNEGKDKAIELDKFDNIVIYDEMGNEISPPLIQAKTVVSIMESHNKTYIRMIVSTRNINGSISAISIGDNERKYFVINGKNYYLDNVHRNDIEIKVRLGEMYNFKTDIFDDIISVENGETNEYKLGYLFNIVFNTDEDMTYLKIFSDEGITKTIPIADYIVIDNIRCSQIKKANDRICEVFNITYQSAVNPQIIGYKVNEEGKCNFIDTSNPRDGELAENSLTKAYESDNVQRSYGISGNASTVRSYGREALINNDTKVFFIPYGSFDKEQCFVGSRNDFLIEERLYYGNTYKTSSNNQYSDVFVCMYTYGNIPKNSDARRDVVMFDNSYLVYDEEEEEVCKMIEVYYGSQKQTISAPGTFNLEGISRGDIISFEYNIHGKVEENSSITKYIDSDDIDAPFSTWNIVDGGRLYNSGKYHQNLQLSFGKTLKNNSNIITLFTDDIYDVVDIADVTNAGLAIYNKSEDIITTNTNDIIGYDVAGDDCTRVVMHTRNSRYMNAYGFNK